MTLRATEFIRRFLLHVLPAGFVRIRHYGFLANRVCRERLALCRELLGVGVALELAAADSGPEAERTAEGEPSAPARPRCGGGPVGLVETLRAPPATRGGE